MARGAKRASRAAPQAPEAPAVEAEPAPVAAEPEAPETLPPAPERPKRWRIRLKAIPRTSDSSEITRSLRWGNRLIVFRQGNREMEDHDRTRETVLETEDADFAQYLLHQGIYEEVR